MNAVGNTIEPKILLRLAGKKQYHARTHKGCARTATLSKVKKSKRPRRGIAHGTVPTQTAPSFSSHMSFHVICWLIAA
jgi:hypothetical protein